jgi:hypothetical protein
MVVSTCAATVLVAACHGVLLLLPFLACRSRGVVLHTMRMHCLGQALSASRFCDNTAVSSVSADRRSMGA